MLKLYAPKEYADQPCCYHEATPEAINEVAGGCGPGGTGDYLVPDTMYFLSVKPACSIHDWMYRWGLFEKHKILSDEVFLNNMIRIIKHQKSCRLIEQLRLRRARIYYAAVRDFGGPAFWSSKNATCEMA